MDASTDQPDLDQWIDLDQCWRDLAIAAPALRIKTGPGGLGAFLREYKTTLLEKDVIRLVNNRRWIAHQARFGQLAFDLMTGVAQ